MVFENKTHTEPNIFIKYYYISYINMSALKPSQNTKENNKRKATGFVISKQYFIIGHPPNEYWAFPSL